MSILSKNSIAITDFHATKTQHVQLFENPLPGTPPFAIPQISEDFWLLVDHPCDRRIFSTCVGGYKNTAIAEKREANPESLVSKEKVNKILYNLLSSPSPSSPLAASSRL